MLPVVEKERTMGDTTRPSAFRSAAPHPSKRFAIVGGYDQVITPIGKVDARFSHAGDYTTNKIYCGNLLWQSSLTLSTPRLRAHRRRCFQGEARHLQSRYEGHNRRAEHAGRLTQGGTEGQGRRLLRAHGRADLKLRRDSTSMPGTPVDCGFR